METLIIVDFQNDFAKKSGPLYVNGAELAEESIVNYINKNANKISDVVFTVDWHSPNHCSFTKNGGEWPVHCIQFSEGAGISNEIIKACILNNINFKVFKKGNIQDEEEYGAFDSIHVNFLNEVIVNNMSVNNPIILNTSNIVVCGIAGDYCVKETIKNLINFKDDKFNVRVMVNGIASIDDGTTLKEFIKENNLEIV